MLSKKQISTFQQEILSWYKVSQRDLPWRSTRNPYNIVVSEMMSQQTQIVRVVPKYLAWIERFPTLVQVAKAPTREILWYWSGLGYNRRALFLQRLAKEISEKYQGEFPQDEKSLLSLPGIGKYTARAILCFAFDKQIAVIDTNIKKVIAVHFFNGEVPEKEVLEDTAQELLPMGKAYEWNQALMDYAAAELKTHKIQIPKHSKFENSDRYYRGQVIKLLLHGEETQDTAFAKIKNKSISKERFEKILKGMGEDGLIVLGEKVQLP